MKTRKHVRTKFKLTFAYIVKTGVSSVRVTVLGGVGAVGSTAVRILVASGIFSEFVIGDIEIEKAEKLVAEVGARNVSAVRVDAIDVDSVKMAIKGSHVVLNCIGPFYKFGPIIMRAAIESKVNYVDLCDDFDATEKLLGMSDEAKKKGVSALIGMGSSPGLANVLVRFCADALLDQVDSIDIYHAHGGEPFEGAAVVKHRLHSMIIGIPVFLDGQFQTVHLFDESGKSLEEDVDFPDVGRYRVHAYPHPETVTLPKYIKGVKRVTNLGLVLPPSYSELIKNVVRLGLTGEQPIEVEGQKVVPLEFAVAYIISERTKLLKKAGMTEPMGCLKIVVKGKKKGENNTFTFSMSSRGKGMPEGTGIPAALGAMLMGLGKIREKGVFPPEGAVQPMELLSLAKEKIRMGSESGLPILVEHTDSKGKIAKTNLETLLRH